MTPETASGAEVKQKILTETGLSSADQNRKVTAENIEDERLTPEKLEKQYNGRLSELDSLEREMDSTFEQITSIKTAIDKREQEDEFQRNKRNNAIDTEDYERLRTAFDEVLERFVPKLVIRDDIQFSTMDQMHDLVDRQQWQQTGKEYVDQVKQLTELFRDHTTQVRDMQQDFNRQQTERLLEAINSLESQQEVAGEAVDAVTELQAIVSNQLQAEDRITADELESVQDQLKTVQQLVETLQEQDTGADDTGDAEEDGTAATDSKDTGSNDAAPQMTDLEERVYHKVRDNPEISNGKIARDISVKKARIADARESLVERGLIGPQG